ncbi:uncharacterized protein PHALS_09591 [Plasmopara halstedii]|uniref:Uncharacterized protein n=1 Tax=Plasmopara halstedii TaxID=4781 RepID=A0A0P1AEV2_PLAHL|nr:uncharacterized protein PHALS_09591 [Plasmopara halstedii]CEG39337.1 hypothetical protein PHALS_09591 [Plasmopara halstedii]|eukprot:XP_024575706.1 hypothetical protein PHALS_09591 [Plasmopara halstedii]
MGSSLFSQISYLTTTPGRLHAARVDTSLGVADAEVLQHDMDQLSQRLFGLIA